jgi:hypothetical protein
LDRPKGKSVVVLALVAGWDVFHNVLAGIDASGFQGTNNITKNPLQELRMFEVHFSFLGCVFGGWRLLLRGGKWFRHPGEAASAL